LKRLGVVALCVLLAAAAIVLLAVVTTNRFLDTPATISEDGVSFEISAGTSFAGVSENLARLEIIDNPRLFRWYARITGDANAIKAGHYRLNAAETPRAILRKFVAGEVELFSFTIVEGWNFRELLTAMAASEHIESSISYEDWPRVLEEFGDDSGHPEGLFLPETYRFPRGTRDVEVLKQAHALMQQVLRDEWPQRSKNLPISSSYEALILASIIEKETARADERAQISGVFTRRLQKRMRLQTDPTVIYGIGPDFNGNITRTDLRTDTPYNTYTRHGLPPTPIAMPGQASIHAALNPADGTALYFVATGIGDGSHKFSATKAEHDAAVTAYLRRMRANRSQQKRQDE